MNVRKEFDIDKTIYKNMLEEQNNQCAICHKSITSQREFDLDHDHLLNEPRSLLCRSCNMGLGLFQDNPQYLREAANYIEKWEDIHKEHLEINEPL